MFFDTSDLKTDEIFLHLTKTSPAQPEKRWLPAYYFEICLSEGTVIGNCDLRVGHNDKTYIGGNVGYNIDAAYRGNRYAAKACQLLFRQARKHGMKYLIITCVPDNLASSRTCEIAGGRVIGIETVPENNELYAEGMRNVLLYRFDIGELY